MGFPMMSYTDWVLKKGFVLKDSYDTVANKWTKGGRLQLFPHQHRVAAHCFTQDSEGNFPYTTVILSAPKKSGKTTWASSICAWFGEVGPPESEIYVCANDLEQAESRVYTDVSYHARKSWGIVPKKYEMKTPNNSVIKALAQEYKSAAGARQALTLWDELWGFVSERSRLMWAEMTPISTVPISLRVIVTYAGILGESRLLQDLYESVVRKGEKWGDAVPELEDLRDDSNNPVCFHKGSIFAYWDTVPRMPWQTPEYLMEQFATLRPAEYMRLHENQWVTTHEAFLPMDLWDQCVTIEQPLIYDMTNAYRRFPISVGVDIGTRHDCSAVVGVYYDSNRNKVGLAFHRIWQPTAGEDFDLEETVEKFIIDMAATFKIVSIVYDPTQFHRSMVTLKKKARLNLKEFPQTATNMTYASQNLYDLIRNKAIEVYSADDLRSHLASARAEDKGRGFRIVKDKHSTGKIDGAIALAMAAYEAISTGGVDISIPIRVEMPFADASGWKQKTPQQMMEEQYLPPELRSN
jgi:phage terminase large subunit-like protein